MGCDIHCYIESKEPAWNEFSSWGGRINPGRNYRIFANLAGVRNYNEVSPVAPPRGFPEDAGYYSRDDYWLYISDEDESDECCTTEQANRWISEGSSVPSSKNPKLISNPDWHSHSWVSPDELEQAISEQNEPKYNAILAAMRSLEKDGHEVRLVFWFDN